MLHYGFEKQKYVVARCEASLYQRKLFSRKRDVEKEILFSMVNKQKAKVRRCEERSDEAIPMFFVHY
jgi:hypothetical protein